MVPRIQWLSVVNSLCHQMKKTKGSQWFRQIDISKLMLKTKRVVLDENYLVDVSNSDAKIKHNIIENITHK